MAIARALFPKAKEPRYVFESLVRLLPEALLAFTRDGIAMKAIDPTKTALFDLQFYATGLEDYVLEEEVKVGLIFTTLKDILKRIRATEKLELEVDRERNRFNIYVYPKKGKEVGLVRRFGVPIVEVMEEEVPELQIDYSATAEIKTDAFVDAINLVKEVSDWVQITIAPEGVTIKGVGDAGKAVEVLFEHGDETLLSLVADETVSSKYSIETIKAFADKMKSVTKSLKIRIANNKPATFEYYFGVGELKVVVAPRVD